MDLILGAFWSQNALRSEKVDFTKNLVKPYVFHEKMKVGEDKIMIFWLPEATFSTCGSEVDFFIDF